MDILNILCIRACLLKYRYLFYSLLILNILGLPHWANLPYFAPMFSGSWLDRQITVIHQLMIHPKCNNCLYNFLKLFF